MKHLNFKNLNINNKNLEKFDSITNLLRNFREDKKGIKEQSKRKVKSMVQKATFNTLSTQNDQHFNFTPIKKPNIEKTGLSSQSINELDKEPNLQ